MSASGQAFRFLDLPPELRFIVYEYLPFSTFHHTVTQARDPDHDEGRAIRTADEYNWVTLVTKGVPVQILATCRLINEEAAPFLRPKVQMLETSLKVPRIICNTDGAGMLIGENEPGILMPLLIWLGQRYTASGEVPSDDDVSLSWKDDAGVGFWLTKTASLLQHDFGKVDPHRVDPLSFRFMIEARDLSLPDVDLTKDAAEHNMRNRMLWEHFYPVPEDHLLHTLLRGITLSYHKVETVGEMSTMVRFFMAHFQVGGKDRPEPTDIWEDTEPGFSWRYYFPMFH